MANKFLIVCGGSGVGLLGQRKVLGVDGEMHIDVREEVDDRLAKSDPFSINVKLDLPASIGTVHQLLVDMKERVGKTILTPEYKAHTLFLANNWPRDEPLKYGLARAPALGGGAIRQADNAIDLDGKLKMMINEWAQDIGPANPIEFWIVSSTAGGTGEGVHRYVGKRIVEILSSKKGAWGTLNFIRIGQATYNAVDPDRTSFNTFFGVAADAAFKVQLQRQYYEEVVLTTRWFYLEVPPVGVGPTAKPIRARLIEIAAKAIMLEELEESLDAIVVNDHIGLVRVGYWGKDFDENVKYHETLRQLLAKLNELIEPDGYAKYILGRPELDFEPGEGLQKFKYLPVTEDLIYQQMNSGIWQFPKYTAPRLPENPNEMWRLVQRWKDSISQLTPSISIDQLEPRFVTAKEVKREDTEELETRRVPLTVPGLGAVEPYTPQWFEKIDNAQRVRAWASHLLGTGQSGEGLLAELHELARACSNAQYPRFPESLSSNTRKKANNLRNYIWEFIETLVKVIKLWELRRAAEEMLEVALDGVKKVRDVVQQQQIIARGAIRGAEESPVIAAELYHPLDQITKDTWLRMLDEAVRRQETDLFKKQVLAGAVALTWSGLVSVLGLRPNSQAPEIQNELRQHMGRMYDRDGRKFEAQWWQAHEPPDITRRFTYRIFPRLGLRTRYELGEGDGEIQYLYTGLGVIGSYVLAFEGLTRSTWQDMVTTPAYLLRPFVPMVRWRLDNKLSIVCAGVGGDPLYKPALIEAGLTSEELERLAEFYELYDPESGPEVTTETPILKHKIETGDFDVFLAHNNADKPQVVAIAETLKQRGIYPWLDIEQVPPGRWFQDVIQQAIPKVKSAAVIIGPKGLGRWQALELRSFISQCVDKGLPVIPVLLPGITELPPELLFLKELNWVRFKESIDEVEALERLEWGIRGERGARLFR